MCARNKRVRRFAPAADLFAGRVRRARALARVLRVRARPRDRAWFAFWEADAALWCGAPARAAALLDAWPLDDERGGRDATVVKLECLVLDERLDEARSLLAAHADVLRKDPRVARDVAFIEGVLRFREGDLDGARTSLERAVPIAGARDPVGPAAHFYLAAVAHRAARDDETRRHLALAMTWGRDHVVVRWAELQWDELFPNEPRPAVRSRIPSQENRRPFATVRLAARVLTLRRAAVQAPVTTERITLLAGATLVVALALRFVDYRPGSSAFPTMLIAVVAPVLALGPIAWLVTFRGGTEAAPRVLTGVYAAAPVLCIVWFTALRLLGFDRPLALAAEVAVGLWSIAIVLRLVRSAIVRAGIARYAAVVAVVACGWALPMHLVGAFPIFYQPMTSDAFPVPDEVAARLFEQADLIHAAERKLLPQRPAVADVYFVGAAGWAHQGVFEREVETARRVLDYRLGTGERSVVLANGTGGLAPFASKLALRHVLRAVGATMDPEEDVLFLLVTSHGGPDGLGLAFPPGSPFVQETLSPGELRDMLDGAGIRWRILVVAGCDSGVFLAPLATESTLVVTTASADRPAYGCAADNLQTEFGRALFVDEFPSARSIPDAFAAAVRRTEARERTAGLVASHPQLFEGADIGEKLREVELSAAP